MVHAMLNVGVEGPIQQGNYAFTVFVSLYASAGAYKKGEAV